MVAKGHDFPEVTLSAILDADATLRFPDFRADERTFAMVAQLAGRSGRGEAGGEVIVQTLAPGAPSIAHAARHDAAGFLAGELERRRVLRYPPFSHLVRVVLCSEAEPRLDARRRRLAGELADALPEGTDLLGPAPMFRVRGRHRRRLLIKADDREGAVAAVREVVEQLAADRSLREVAHRRRRRSAVAPTSPTHESLRLGYPMSDERRQDRRAASDRLEAELLERREAALAQVVKFGDPVLKSKASPVAEFGPELRAEVERMIAIMRDGMGVGLAATQLGILRRLLVFQAGPDASRPRWSTRRSSGSPTRPSIAEEGCLSLPRVSMDVERPLHARVAGLDVDGRAGRARGLGPRGARAPARDRPPRRRPDPRPHAPRAAQGRAAGAARGRQLQPARARTRTTATPAEHREPRTDA